MRRIGRLTLACLAILLPGYATHNCSGQEWSPSGLDASRIEQESRGLGSDSQSTPDTPSQEPSSSDSGAQNELPEQRTAPRSVHEYGPPGHVRRRQDRGASTPALQSQSFSVPPEDKQFHGSFPGSVKIPGTSTSLRIGGFVRGQGIFDFNPIDAQDDFDTTKIPVPQQAGQNATFTARATRIEIESHTDSACLGDVKTYLEMDFFESKTQTDFASYRLRSRKLYLDVGWFRFGQDASVFTDYDSYPSLIDYEMMGSKLLLRNALVRMTIPVREHVKIAVSAEQPFTDMSVPVDLAGNPVGDTEQDVPDFATHLRYDSHWGHIQLGGVIRELGFRPTGSAVLTDTGYGGAISGDFHPWARLRCELPSGECVSPLAKCRVVGEFVSGYGISRYLADPHEADVDAGLTSAGELEALFTRGWYLGYEHWWRPCWMSTIAYGENANSGTDTLPGSTYAGSKYAGVNLKWVPTKKFWLGVEYLWGQRQDLDRQAARARRLQFGAQYNF
ncbi:MAG: DcaP family trimeric outer membrane transporter [Pirellulaceae bacterium]